MTLLSPMRSNPKTAKQAKGFEGVILHLAPHNLADPSRSVCAWASWGCIKACLNTSGHGQSKHALESDAIRSHHIHRARIRRTNLFWDNRPSFFETLHRELNNLEKRAANKGKRPIARLNGTSDLAWERFGIPQAHPRIQFYNYSKSWNRCVDALEGVQNYALTYSRVETDRPCEIRAAVQMGVNVAVVFETMPDEWEGIQVIDGTKHDWRFKDPWGVIVGLLPMGRAKQDRTGFVVRN